MSLGAFDEGGLCGVVAVAGRWVKLLAVAPEQQRRGVGSALLSACTPYLTGPLRIGDHPGNYLSPGLDVRYEAGRAFFDKLGLRPVAEVENLRVPLDGNPRVSAARSQELDHAVRAQGYDLRRAEARDHGPLLAFIERAFAPVWAFEVGRALAGRSLVHLASAGGVPVAFAAIDGNNRGLGWFGPAGTLPEHRGRRLGEALLLRCLIDARDLPEGGVIAWIGPKQFYARAAGAVADRRFVVYERPS
jgi:GNAT superfamily N-acetyltransferase